MFCLSSIKNSEVLAHLINCSICGTFVLSIDLVNWLLEDFPILWASSIINISNSFSFILEGINGFKDVKSSLASLMPILFLTASINGFDLQEKNIFFFLEAISAKICNAMSILPVPSPPFIITMFFSLFFSDFFILSKITFLAYIWSFKRVKSEIFDIILEALSNNFFDGLTGDCINLLKTLNPSPLESKSFNLLTNILTSSCV